MEINVKKTVLPSKLNIWIWTGGEFKCCLEWGPPDVWTTNWTILSRRVSELLVE